MMFSRFLFASNLNSQPNKYRGCRVQPEKIIYHDNIPNSQLQDDYNLTTVARRTLQDLYKEDSPSCPGFNIQHLHVMETGDARQTHLTVIKALMRSVEYITMRPLPSTPRRQAIRLIQDLVAQKSRLLIRSLVQHRRILVAKLRENQRLLSDLNFKLRLSSTTDKWPRVFFPSETPLLRWRDRALENALLFLHRFRIEVPVIRVLTPGLEPRIVIPLWVSFLVVCITGVMVASELGAKTSTIYRLKAKYEALEANIKRTAKPINLLELKPGLGDEEIVCTLSSVILCGTDDYEALSYVWGDPTLTRRIYCDGQKVQVGGNLHSALKHLRYSDRARTLWVDALCIDQSNNDEKSEQVKMMGDIYSQASGVIVWLGEEKPSTGVAFDLIDQLEEYLWKTQPNFVTKWIYGRGHFLKQEIGGKTIGDLDFGPLVELLQYPWFRRVWIIQEAVKARKLTFVCGVKTMSWDSFGYVIASLHALRIEKMFERSTQQSIHNLRTISMARKQRNHEGKSDTLLGLYLGARGFDCTISKDRLFGLLGIANDVGPDDTEVQPDYSLDANEVFKRFAVWRIIKNNDLSSLSWAYNPRITRDPDLPTWVPDVARLDVQEQFDKVGVDAEKPGKRAPFSASGEATAKSLLSDDRMVLHVQGKIVDHIIVVGRTTEEMLEDPTDPDLRTALSMAESPGLLGHTWFEVAQNLAWLKECAAIASSDQDGTFIKPSRILVPQYVIADALPLYAMRQIFRWSEIAGPSPQDAFWQTIACGLTYRGDRLRWRPRYPASFNCLLQMLDRSFKEPDKWLLDHWPRPGEGHRFMQLSIERWSPGRRFSIRGSGGFGCVPRAAVAGDLICVIYGVRYPLVIRQMGEDYYTVIGECYMHGLMDGEAMDMTTVQSQEIALR